MNGAICRGIDSSLLYTNGLVEGQMHETGLAEAPKMTSLVLFGLSRDDLGGIGDVAC